MTTELINLGEYRKNLSSLWKKSSKENIKYLVTVHGKPAFEVTPVTDNTIDDDWTEYTPENHKAWLEAREELDAGESVEFGDFLESNKLYDIKKKYEA